MSNKKKEEEIQKAIEEKNALIAKYYYPDFVHPQDQDPEWQNSKEDVAPMLETCRGSYSAMATLLFREFREMHYHNSYNALMPIVKHIMNDVSVDIGKYKESPGWYAYYSIESLVSYEAIEKVYEEVVRYITWYNENIKVHDNDKG